MGKHRNGTELIKHERGQHILWVAESIESKHPRRKGNNTVVAGDLSSIAATGERHRRCVGIADVCCVRVVNRYVTKT